MDGAARRRRAVLFLRLASLSLAVTTVCHGAQVALRLAGGR
jgi:hypothetical protein